MKRPPLRTSATFAAFLALSFSCGDDKDKDPSGSPEGGARDASTADASLDGSAMSANDAATDGASATDAMPSEAGADAGQTIACDATKAPDVGGLALQTVFENVDRLVYAVQPPNSTDWYLVRQTGQVLHSANGAAPTPFLDLSSEIALGGPGDERGLLGLAFPPDFATSKLFYVMLSPTSGEDAGADVVREYRRDANSSAFVQTIVEIPSSEPNHNGGTIQFGPDGFLYVGTGDGGGSCNSNKPGTPQDVASLYGKILRLDVKNKAGNFAAAGNPFPENTRVLHYGLRNPFRFHVDRTNGDLYVADVGQGAYEEVSFAKGDAKAINFGWAAFEGNAAGNTVSGCSARPLRAGSMHTAPFFTADRRMVGCTENDKLFCDWKSVISGFVYRGNAVPKLRGTYLFGDYVGERMVALQYCDAGVSPITVINKARNANEPMRPYFVDSGKFSLVAIVEDNQGEMYFVTRTDLAGSLRKVVAR